MKKTIVMMLCLLMAGVSGVKAQSAKIILHHNGTPTFFYASDTQAALDAAVEGDTLYLNEGSFQGGVTISKKIVIIGYGEEKSVIGGNVSIAIGDGGESLTKPLLSGVTVRGDINIDKAVKGLVIMKSSFESIFFNADVEESNLIQCWIYGTSSSKGIHLSEHVKTLTVSNSKIKNVSGDAYSAESAFFKNCNIENLHIINNDCLCLATYANCIFDGMGNATTYSNLTTTYINCILYHDPTNIRSEIHNCWQGPYNILDNNCNCSQTDEQLLSAGYVGTDGTVVGINGGETPYSLTMNAPKITDYSAKVDADTHKVTINLKVSNN